MLYGNIDTGRFERSCVVLRQILRTAFQEYTRGHKKDRQIKRLCASLLEAGLTVLLWERVRCCRVMRVKAESGFQQMQRSNDKRTFHEYLGT